VTLPVQRGQRPSLFLEVIVFTTESIRTVQKTRGAALLGTKCVLRVEVLGYEFPHVTTGLDADWLIVRADWLAQTGRLRCEGAHLLADELAAWGASIATLDLDEIALAFTEPNLRFAYSKRGPDLHVARIEMLCESSQGDIQLETSLEVSSIMLTSFGRGLQALARRFPARSRSRGRVS